jgi:hypothetical protein
MKGSIVYMMNIGETLIPCEKLIGIIHAQDMHDHSIYDLGLAICMGVEGHGFGELGVQQ